MISRELDISPYQERLLPCPFCGRKMNGLEIIDEEDEWNPPKLILNCTWCGALHYSFIQEDTEKGLTDAINENIRLWNRRPGQK